ncbi:protogenin A, partial [Aplysia californica]|uniref:Protogenin A n=1 Tax=Aplysia californica TaxID=6500 RepID=A0ABM1A658_APLCA
MDGLYVCKVKTTKGILIARRVHVVMSVMARNFSQEPASREAYQGGVARFTCDIKAEPPTSYEWFKDKKQLSSERFHTLSSGILQISDVQDSDAGFYLCQTTSYLHDFRIKKSGKAELRVLSDVSERPARFVAAPANTTVTAGNTAELECLVDGNPKPSVEWRRKDTDLRWRGQALSGPGNLVLTNVGPKDEGIYECVLFSRGLTKTAAAKLTVQVAPKLEQGLESYSFPVTKVMTTACLVSGSPAPNISWYLNGELIEKTGLYTERIKKTGGESMILYTLQKKHSGFYQCVAENGVDQVMSVAFLQVSQKELAPRGRPTNVTAVTTSTSILVTWDNNLVQSDRPSVVAYQVVGERFPRQKICTVKENTWSQQCTVKNLRPATNYSLTVQAYNKYGASDLSDIIYVQTLPDVPSKLPEVSVSSPEFHSMLISWTTLSAEDSRGQLQAYRVYYRRIGQNEESR